MAEIGNELKFRSPFDIIIREPLTLVELRMRWFSGEIRNKPNWWKKVHDDEIVSHWRQEIIEHDAVMVDRFWGGEERWETGSGEKKWPRDKITDLQLNYLLDELRYDASQYDEETGIFATTIHMVYESRSLIPAGVKASLVRGVSVLEDVPEEDKDWHPGSNQQVLDLVHPSMYCSHTSQGYQWLPTDFEVSESGQVKPLAYINNLHPIHHRALYPIISSVLTRFVPLFEKVISDAASPWPPLAVRPNPCTWYDHIPEHSDLNDENQYEEWESKFRWPLIPEPELFVPSKVEHRRNKLSLCGRTLQVIIKLANIILTPENPKYPGGSWHVEGMRYENIVASGIYYYACENITESRLEFRTAVGGDLPYEQYDDRGYLTAYAMQCDSPMNQLLGHTVAEEDKCIAFPNIYQHRVDEFELADPTKPGHRKILCFFVINPFARITSTSDVPPQQAHWALDELAKAPLWQKLPQELADMIWEYVGLVSRTQAESDREEVIGERSWSAADNNTDVFEVEFNMCEH